MAAAAVSSSSLLNSLFISLLLLLSFISPASGRLITESYDGLKVGSRPHQLPPGEGQYAFIPRAPQWNRKLGPSPRILTYALSPDYSHERLGREEIIAAVRGATGRWAAVIPLRFQETSDFQKADIKIGFYQGEQGGTLAYAYPMDEWDGTLINIDAMDHWTTDLEKDANSKAMDLETVLVHEVGHVLGLAHTTRRSAVMFPALGWRERKVELGEEDIRGVQALFRLKPSISWKTATIDEVRVNCYKFGRCVFMRIVVVAVLLLHAAVVCHIWWCINQINCCGQDEEEKTKTGEFNV